MKGCDRCGHLKREHNWKTMHLVGERLIESGTALCSAKVGPRLCLCPRYLKPRTMA